MHGQPNPLLQYGVPVLIFVVIFGLRARRMTRVRPLKLEYLWIVPAIYLALTIMNVFFRPPTFAFTMPSLNAWLAAMVAVVAGAVVGWQRGRMMQILVDPETGTLSQKGSPLAILFLLAIILIKMFVQGEGKALGFDVQVATDAAFAFGLGMFTMTRVEMYLRGKRLLGEARA